jgi:hypothetical protein
MAPEMPSDCPAGQRTQPIGALRQGGLRTRDPWDAEIARRYWRGPLSKMGPKYLRWALIEAAVHAAQHPIYSEHSQRTKTRLGRQRGPRWPGSRWPASSPSRSGTCSRRARTFLSGKVPLRIWSRLTTLAELDQPELSREIQRFAPRAPKVRWPHREPADVALGPSLADSLHGGLTCQWIDQRGGSDDEPGW